MKYIILKVLLYLLVLSFIPLMLEVTEIANISRPDLILPIIGTSLLIALYFVFLLIHCAITKKDNCFGFKKSK